MRLNELTPRQFELFSRKLIQAYGFSEVEVTELHSDGGIDGHGKLRLGLATMRVAFQCKRWKASVGRPDVDKFRGAIQGEFEQGFSSQRLILVHKQEKLRLRKEQFL